MLNKKIRKDIRDKVIAGLLIGLAVLGMFIGFKTQQDKINELEYQLNIKQQVQERATDYTVTTYDTKNIQLKFNEIKEYKIMSSEISMKHKYIYEDEAFLGLHRKAILTANANVYFQYNVALADAEINETENKIIITISKAYLDKDTVHIVPNTFVRIEDECSHNILSNYEVGRKVQQYWNDSAVEKSYNYIEEYFNDSCKVQAYTKEQIKNLVQTLTNKNVEIIIKNS